jgi:hypothetical protein
LLPSAHSFLKNVLQIYGFVDLFQIRSRLPDRRRIWPEARHVREVVASSDAESVF